ncbi:hypothetical protein LOKO_02831 [Halomonas chromatireducens]|uniref:Uncharacterized protein n=2 Tax=Halomonas chromatireducens TaxID=507626 RepID=A0A109UML7_9GAMM|nr:hypothetical protein LOKO_02831 [Halomonas chromatireducens]
MLVVAGLAIRQGIADIEHHGPDVVFVQLLLEAGHGAGLVALFYQPGVFTGRMSGAMQGQIGRAGVVVGSGGCQPVSFSARSVTGRAIALIDLHPLSQGLGIGLQRAFALSPLLWCRPSMTSIPMGVVSVAVSGMVIVAMGVVIAAVSGMVIVAVSGMVIVAMGMAIITMCRMVIVAMGMAIITMCRMVTVAMGVVIVAVSGMVVVAMGMAIVAVSGMVVVAMGMAIVAVSGMVVVAMNMAIVAVCRVLFIAMGGMSVVVLRAVSMALIGMARAGQGEGECQAACKHDGKTKQSAAILSGHLSGRVVSIRGSHGLLLNTVKRMTTRWSHRFGNGIQANLGGRLSR